MDTGREEVTTELYVSAGIRHPYDSADPVVERIEIALPQQAQPDTLRYQCSTEPDGVCEIVVERRPGFATEFESVEVLH